MELRAAARRSGGTTVTDAEPFQLPTREPMAAVRRSVRTRFSIVAILAALAGLALGTILVAYYGFGAVGAALARAGWAGLFAITGVHLLFLVLCGFAWAMVIPPPRTMTSWVFVWGRLIRDAGSEVLPLSQIGGYVMGARAIMLLGASGDLATASTIVDITMELLAQLAYTALGLGLLLWLHPGASLTRPIEFGLAAAVVVTITFILAQRRGFMLIERLAQRLANQWLGRAVAGTPTIRNAIARFYRGGRGLGLAFSLHLVSWIASGIEAWIALQFLEAPLGLAAVIAIESLLYAIRSVAFAVPNAVGVQEGAYVMLGAIFGLGPEAALALSLLKRARDILIGVPALLIWQSLEGRRLWRRSSAVTRPGPSEDS